MLQNHIGYDVFTSDMSGNTCVDIDKNLRFLVIKYIINEIIDNKTLWKAKLATLKQYIDEHHATPSTSSKNKDVKTLGK